MAAAHLRRLVAALIRRHPFRNLQVLRKVSRSTPLGPDDSSLDPVRIAADVEEWWVEHCQSATTGAQRFRPHGRVRARDPLSLSIVPAIGVYDTPALVCPRNPEEVETDFFHHRPSTLTGHDGVSADL